MGFYRSSFLAPGKNEGDAIQQKLASLPSPFLRLSPRADSDCGDKTGCTGTSLDEQPVLALLGQTYSDRLDARRKIAGRLNGITLSALPFVAMSQIKFRSSTMDHPSSHLFFSIRKRQLLQTSVSVAFSLKAITPGEG